MHDALVLVLVVLLALLLALVPRACATTTIAGINTSSSHTPTL